MSLLLTNFNGIFKQVQWTIQAILQLLSDSLVCKWRRSDFLLPLLLSVVCCHTRFGSTGCVLPLKITVDKNGGAVAVTITPIPMQSVLFVLRAYSSHDFRINLLLLSHEITEEGCSFFTLQSTHEFSKQILELFCGNSATITIQSRVNIKQIYHLTTVLIKFRDFSTETYSIESLYQE